MYRRYYDGYRNVGGNEAAGEVIVPQTNDTYREADKQTTAITSAGDSIEVQGKSGQKGVLGLDCELDDLILIGILLFLTWDKDNVDPVMLVIIGFIFLSEFL